MTSAEIVTLVLSSSLLSAIATTVLGGIVSGLLKRADYADEYYKQVLQRRIEAYEVLEAQIGLLKQSVLDNDKKIYHLVFAYGIDKFHELQQGLMLVMSKSLWLSEELQNAVVDINREFLDASFRASDDASLVAVGKVKYERIATLRHSLEHIFSEDIGSLHEIKRFLRAKAKSSHEFSPFYISQDNRS